MYMLIESLKKYEYSYAVYPFGEFVHYSDKRTDFNPNNLKEYLKNKTFIIFKSTKPKQPLKILLWSLQNKK